jgi:hypothetical protein
MFEKAFFRSEFDDSAIFLEYLIQALHRFPALCINNFFSVKAGAGVSIWRLTQSRQSAAHSPVPGALREIARLDAAVSNSRNIRVKFQFTVCCAGPQITGFPGSSFVVNSMATPVRRSKVAIHR